MNPYFKSLIVVTLLLIVSASTISAGFFTSVSGLLTQSIWNETESWRDEDGDGLFVFDSDSCQADNNWLFRSDGTFQMTENIRKCEPDMSFLDTINATWSLKSNETILSLGFKEFDVDYEIIAIGEHEIILHIKDSDNPTAPTWEKMILRR